MVGAGLSRQTEPGHPTEKQPPTWKQLAVLLQEQLRCGKPGSGQGCSGEPVTARDCSRLAQQYKATFGQSALDSFLLANVPDGEPDLAHKRLLRLPWADVFTTNWDTLLEKASRRVTAQTYDHVLCSADLATTVAPRIVKLHGSFPSNRPFVVTEEDYRTYPSQFAPFVNTVQQALMESIFLLIGFSGDDPNFLHWCGWVRDHLGPAAPRLYLAGKLNLDQPSRLMLEERGVIPIDLASEVSGAKSCEEGHRRAIDWILSSLEAGETWEERWPLPPPHTASGGEPGIALPVPPSGQPQEAPEAPSKGHNSEAMGEQVKNVSKIWRHNRRVYPGWPILPFSKHRRLLNSTKPWVEPMLSVAPSLNFTDRLIVLRELLERVELLMDPMTSDLINAANDVLNNFEESLARASKLSDESLQEIEEDRIALMLAVLTDSRHDLNQTSFDEWAGKLLLIVRPGTSEFHRLQHERCLWKLRVQDFSGLGDLLNSWRTEGTTPMWSLRKAALMLESGDIDGGQDLALQTLQHAEQAWSRDHRVLTASRLGWALHWRHALNWAQWWDKLMQGKSSWQPEADLWARLAPHDGDARSDLDAYVREMIKEQREDSPWTFDLRRVNRITLSNEGDSSFRSAWRVIRLLELSGIPSGIQRVRIVKEHVERAARLVAHFAPAYAARLLLLVGGKNDKALDAVVSQTHLARMSDQEVSELFDAAQRARDHFLGQWPTSGEADDYYRARAQNSIEIMSRCLARHGVASALESFRWAIHYSRPRRWVDNQFWSCVTLLWERSWNALDLESRASAVGEILNAPIPEDALLTDIDPGDLLLSEYPRINRSDIDEEHWVSCVHQISTALRGSDDTRRLAFNRLNALSRKRLLSQAEEQELAFSLWGTMHQESDGLPQIRLFDDWVYLVLPEPEHGIAERRFRAKWISRDLNEATGENGANTIRNVSAAWNPDHLGQRTIRLSEGEKEWFWRFVENWLRHESSRRLVTGTSSDQAVGLLLDVMTHRQAPDSVLHRLAENVSTITRRRMPIALLFESPENEYLMIAASVALGGGDSGEGKHRLRVGARHTEGRVSMAAWNALHWWIVQSGRDAAIRLVPPSVEDIRDIGVAIATSQQSGMCGALRAAYAVYRGGNSEYIEAIHSRIIQGLSQFRSELDYRTSVLDRNVAEELPLRRHWCVRLAWAMADTSRGEDEVVRSWIKAGDDDPLLIVRFVREGYAASKASGD